jgi:hypothetical protein
VRRVAAILLVGLAIGTFAHRSSSPSYALRVTRRAVATHPVPLNCPNPVTLSGPEEGVDFPPYRVNMDFWAQGAWKPGAQTMSVCNEHDWIAMVNLTGAPATGVKTYPDSERRYTDYWHCASQPPIGSFTKQVGRYSHAAPAAGSYDYAWDLWLDGAICKKPAIEVMVLTRWRNVDYPTAQLSPTIDHVVYDLNYSRPAGFFQFRQRTQSNAGTVDLLKVLHWMVRNGFVTLATTQVTTMYGPEVLTTRGRDVPFVLDGFSVDDQLALSQRARYR